jgi:hypothetical protein
MSATKTTQTELHTTKAKKVTYLGRRAEVFTIARSANAAKQSGERVSVVRWLDSAVGQPTEYSAGTIVASHIEGDGRTTNFVRYDEQIVTDPMQYAQQRLA